MLTIKQLTENTDAVVRGLEKKHFKNGELVDKQIGSAPKATFVAKLEALL